MPFAYINAMKTAVLKHSSCNLVRLSIQFTGAGEKRETINLINPGNIFQEIREHLGGR